MLLQLLEKRCAAKETGSQPALNSGNKVSPNSPEMVSNKTQHQRGTATWQSAVIYDSPHTVPIYSSCEVLTEEFQLRYGLSKYLKHPPFTLSSHFVGQATSEKGRPVACCWLLSWGPLSQSPPEPRRPHQFLWVT